MKKLLYLLVDLFAKFEQQYDFSIRAIATKDRAADILKSTHIELWVVVESVWNPMHSITPKMHNAYETKEKADASIAEMKARNLPQTVAYGRLSVEKVLLVI